MKKKSVFNNNEVDIDLLVNQPKHIRKLLGKKKDRNEEDEVEEDEDKDDNEEDDTDTKSISPHMKRYIEEYIDSKKVKKKERPENFMQNTLNKLNDKHKNLIESIAKKSSDNAAEHKGQGIIENYLKNKFKK